MKALTCNRDWEGLEAFAKSKKSPIGYEPFVVSEPSFWRLNTATESDALESPVERERTREGGNICEQMRCQAEGGSLHQMQRMDQSCSRGAQ